MTKRFNDKKSAREAVWKRLEDEKLAAFPFPPHGRIPNFKGARQAAERLFTIPAYANAKILKINPDSAQRPVRAETLRRDITIYVPTPGLRAGFLKLDPKTIPFNEINKAATMKSAPHYATEVSLEELPQPDAIVCGSVAVTAEGARCGKGAGYSDIEFAILAELGHAPVPVATTVHGVQVVDAFPQESNDQPLSYIATPDSVIKVDHPPAPPLGIEWDRLTAADLEAMPVLAELRALLAARAKD